MTVRRQLTITRGNIAGLPLRERKTRLAALLKNPPVGIAYSDHKGGDGEAFRRAACEHRLEGIGSKRFDGPYCRATAGAWVKTKLPQPGRVRDRRMVGP
jgi:bifunctional non-homologous end joining protein LigD